MRVSRGWPDPMVARNLASAAWTMNPMVKNQISKKALGYSWATDGLFLGYKAKRPL